ncbi:MAG: hypothetical protein ACJA0N_000514, partial [Pseudohongiellaceae bacterium]
MFCYYRTLCFIVLCCVIQPNNAFSSAIQYINDYGQLPLYRSLAISPDGEHFTNIERGKDNDMLVIRKVDTRKIIYYGHITQFKARSTYFLTNKHVLLRGSNTMRTWGYKGRRENTGALVYNIETKKFSNLLRFSKNIHPAQTGLGRIVGLDQDREVVYMPAYDIGGYDVEAPYHLYRVNLNTGKGRLHAKGTRNTIDWFVGDKGKVLAREEYHEDDQRHIIRSKLSGNWKAIYDVETPIPDVSVQ